MTDSTTPILPGGLGATPPRPPQGALQQVPGVIAISLYMVMLAAVIVFGVVSGGHYPPVFLFFSVFMLAASGGLLLLFRWAWAPRASCGVHSEEGLEGGSGLQAVSIMAAAQRIKAGYVRKLRVRI